MGEEKSEEKREPKTDTLSRKNNDFIDRISHIRNMLTTPNMYRQKKVNMREGRSNTVRPESAKPDFYTMPRSRPHFVSGSFTCNAEEPQPVKKLERTEELDENWTSDADPPSEISTDRPRPRTGSKDSFKIRDSRKSNSTFFKRRSDSLTPNVAPHKADHLSSCIQSKPKFARNISVSTSSFLKSGNPDSDDLELSTSTVNNSELSLDDAFRNDQTSTMRKNLFTPIRPKSAMSSSYANVHEKRDSGQSNTNVSGAVPNSRNLSGVSLQTRKMLGRLCKSRDSLNSLNALEENEEEPCTDNETKEHPKHRKHSLGIEMTTEMNGEDKENVESSDESESSKSKEKVMEWLNVQQQQQSAMTVSAAQPDIIAHCEVTNNNSNKTVQQPQMTVSSNTTQNRENTTRNRTVVFDPLHLPTERHSHFIDRTPEPVVFYRQQSLQEDPVGEADIRVNRYEQSLLKYIEQLQQRFEHLETETIRVVNEFETMNKKWALDKERMQVTEQERIILSERNAFMQRQRDVDKQRIQSALKQYSSLSGEAHLAYVRANLGSPSPRMENMDMDGAITQVETLLMSLGRDSTCEQTLPGREEQDMTFLSLPDPHTSSRRHSDIEIIQDIQDELSSTRLSLTMTENRNNYLSQEIASLTIQLKNANRTAEHLRKTRDEQKRAMKQVLDMSNYKTRTESPPTSHQNLCEESSSVLTQTVCSRVSKSDVFVKDLERILAKSEVNKTDSPDIIDSITSLIDNYYVTWSDRKRDDLIGTPVLSHRRRLSMKKSDQKEIDLEVKRATKTNTEVDFV
ncbi:uncharacterized protein LOC142339528 isoform X2 [Convolutriloba macropyga]